MLLIVIALVPGSWIRDDLIASPSLDAWIYFAFGCFISTPLLFAMEQRFCSLQHITADDSVGAADHFYFAADTPSGVS